MNKDTAQPKSPVVSRDFTIGISALVLGCFLLSGLTGLIYEILWTRMIVKVIGSAPFAVSIVLTVFMGGLGLGSYLAGRMIDRVEAPQRLLRIYALLELGIAGYGIVLPGLILAFKPLYSILYKEFFSYFLFYNTLTLAGCFILFIIPVTCMGATLPVLCRFYIVQLGHLGARAGRLYALNTIGAAAGSLLCGFWLISLWGVWGTLLFAVLINSLIGAACLYASSRVKTWPSDKDHLTQGSTSIPAAEQISHGPLLSHSSGEVVGALFIFAISGYCAMAYEVIWTRLLGLIIGPTTYSFTIVLATFIVGLGLGSLIFGWLADKIKKPLWLLLFTQLAAAFLALGISQLLGNSQFLFAKLIDHFKEEFNQLALIKAGIVFGLMLGPTLCLGATFPLVGKIYTRSVATVGRSIGFAYAINTLGAVLGSFCAGFLLVPWLGKEQSLSLVTGFQILTSLLIGGYLLWEKKAKTVSWITLGVTALIGLVLCSSFPSWNRQILSMGRYHRFENLNSALNNCGWIEALWLGPKILAKHASNAELLYYGDGVGGFTTVFKDINALGTPEYSLVNSGKPDASSRGDMPTQTLAAHFPLLFHPNPKEVLVVGLASGITAGEVLHYPVERLDIVEISEEVVSASNFFLPWNNSVLTHPTTELIIQDGRAHLALTERTYDVITSEPSNPWMAGIASLFTRECFLLAKERLNEEGIFVQFIHSYQMDWDTFALVCRTFFQVFPQSLLVTTIPDTTTNMGTQGDYLLIGLKGINRLMLEHAEKNIVYARQSENVTLPDPRLLYRLVVSEDLGELVGAGPIHTDNLPLLEFAAPKQMHTHDSTIGENIRSNRRLSQETQAILGEITSVEDQLAFAAFALSIYQPFSNMVNLPNATVEQKKQFFTLMEDYCTKSLINDYSIITDQALKDLCLSAQIETTEKNIHLVPDKAVAYNHLGDAYYQKGEQQRAVEAYQKTVVTNPESKHTHISLGNAYFAMGETDEALSEYKQALAIDPTSKEAHGNLGIIYLKKGMVDEAISNLKKALDIEPRYEKAHYNLGDAYFEKDMLDEAITEYKKTIALNPNNAKAYGNLGIAYSKKEMLDEAIAAYKKAIAIDPDFGKAHNNLSVAYYYKGNYSLAVVHCDKALALKCPVNPNYLQALQAYR